MVSGEQLRTFGTKVVHTSSGLCCLVCSDSILQSHRCRSLKYRDKTSLHPTIPLQSSKNSSTILRVDPAELGYVKFIASAISER